MKVKAGDWNERTYRFEKELNRNSTYGKYYNWSVHTCVRTHTAGLNSGLESAE